MNKLQLNKKGKIGYKNSKGYKIFSGFNYIFLWFIAFLCFFPLLHMFSVSLSAREFADTGSVFLLPKGITLDAYKYVLKNELFFSSLKITVFRVFYGIGFGVIQTVLLAYPMSKPKEVFRGRWFFLTMIVITMFFSGGLVPSFILIKNLGLYDTPWVYVLPGLNTYYAMLMMNFFRSQPVSIEEAANLDGCDYFQCLIHVTLPLSTPVIATIILYIFVGQWNSWFDGLIYSSSSANYPLQTVLYDMLTTLLSNPTNQNQAEAINQVGGQAVASAQIFLTTLPIICVYPLVQKYFTEGIVLGSVKG